MLDGWNTHLLHFHEESFTDQVTSLELNVFFLANIVISHPLNI